MKTLFMLFLLFPMAANAMCYTIIYGEKECYDAYGKPYKVYKVDEGYSGRVYAAPPLPVVPSRDYGMRPTYGGGFTVPFTDASGVDYIVACSASGDCVRQ